MLAISEGVVAVLPQRARPAIWAPLGAEHLHGNALAPSDGHLLHIQQRLDKQGLVAALDVLLQGSGHQLSLSSLQLIRSIVRRPAGSFEAHLPQRDHLVVQLIQCLNIKMHQPAHTSTHHEAAGIQGEESCQLSISLSSTASPLLRWPHLDRRYSCTSFSGA